MQRTGTILMMTMGTYTIQRVPHGAHWKVVTTAKNHRGDSLGQESHPAVKLYGTETNAALRNRLATATIELLEPKCKLRETQTYAVSEEIRKIAAQDD